MKILCSDANSSAETVASNEDLITEILWRVPPKPLLQFKSVSKFWLTLISSPRFSDFHSRQNPAPKLSGIFLHKLPAQFQLVPFNSNNSVASPPFKSLDFVRDPGDIKILQSCNGLLLCSSFGRTHTIRSYYVYNPTTNQFSKLPPILSDVSSSVSGFNLAFEPSKSPYYKVVCVHSTVESMYRCQIEIYSSETRAWRLSGSPFVAPFDMVFSQGVFCNGALHWISPRANSIYFDVDNERLGKMPRIPILDQWSSRRFRYFGESRGHLHLIEVYGSRANQFKVFEMEKDYSKWVVKYQVDLDDLVAAYPQMVRSYLDDYETYYAFVILLLVREDEESSLLLHIPGKVISYDLRRKTFKELCQLSASYHGNKIEKAPLQFGFLEAYQYFETLAGV